MSRLKRSIPIFRIFDEAKAREFYIGYLGFAIDFEHRFHEGAPLFMGISRGDVVLFLSEHHGDGNPGHYVRVDVDGLDELHRELQSKRYKYMNPGIQEQDWGREVVVYDPFGNRLIFNEPKMSNAASTSQGGASVKFEHPTPELPVEDVGRAQAHYRDAFGFEIGWCLSDASMGAVSRDGSAVFFRRTERPFDPRVHWVYAPNIDAMHDQLRERGARIVVPLDRTSYGLWVFTVEDLDGNRFHFHSDAPAS